MSFPGRASPSLVSISVSILEPSSFARIIRTLDGPVVGGGVAHVGPIEVTGCGVHNDAVGKPPSFTHDDLKVGPVRIGGKNFATARTEKKQAGRRGLYCVFVDF